MDCIFCNKLNTPDVIMENKLAVAFRDAFPVSQGHTLIIPKRHIKTLFDLTSEEMMAIFDLAQKVKEELVTLYHPDGFNVGFNCGEAAGQTVMHCHMHIIPRYTGDTIKPRGGVRNIVPNKSNY